MSFINKDIIEESINKINEVEVKSFMVNNRLLQYYQFWPTLVKCVRFGHAWHTVPNIDKHSGLT